MSQKFILWIWKVQNRFWSAKRAFNRKWKIPFLKRFYLLFCGFCSHEFTLYDLKKYNRKDYFTDRIRGTRVLTMEKDYFLTILTRDKLIFSELIKSHVNVSDTVATIKKGKVHEWNGSGIHNTDELLDYFKKINDKNMIVKPNNLRMGMGIFVLRYEKNIGFLHNEEPISEEKLREKFSKLSYYLVSHYVCNGAYSAAVFGKTCNTVRIMTLIDPDTDRAFVARAVHRFGCEKSYPVDNAYKGGLFVSLDEKNGKAQRAVRIENGRYVDITSHPDSGADFVDFCVPNWDKVVENITRLANAVKYKYQVCWDVAVHDDGSITIIEGNFPGDCYVLQAYEPFLIDPRIRKFYQYHGVIK